MARGPVTCCYYPSSSGKVYVVCAQANNLCPSSIKRGRETISIDPVRTITAANCGGCHPRKVRPR